MLYGILGKKRNGYLPMTVAGRGSAEKPGKGPCIAFMAFVVGIQGDSKDAGICF